MSIEETKNVVASEEVQAAVAAMKEEIAAEQKAEVEETQECNVTLSHLNHKIKMMSIEDVDYDAKWNVRDVSLYDARVDRKYAELMTDRYIRTPFVACEIVMTDPNGERQSSLIGACGFVRSRALMRIKERAPEVYKACFAKVPVDVVCGCTHRDRELLMLDHGSEEPLNEYEVYRAVARMVRMNVYTEKDIVNTLLKLFLGMISVEDTRSYQEKCKILLKEGSILVGTALVRNVEDFNLKFFRGRFQFYKRIVMSCGNQVENEFRAYVMREPGYVKLTWKMAEELTKMTEAEIAAYFQRLRGDKKPGETAPSEKKDDPRVWGPAKLADAEKVVQSETLKKLFGTTLGKAQGEGSSLPDLDEELVKIESAKKKDPARFWATIDAILAEPVVQEPVVQEPVVQEPVAVEPAPDAEPVEATTPAE